MTFRQNHENWLADKRECVLFAEKAYSMMNMLKYTTSCDAVKVARIPWITCSSSTSFATNKWLLPSENNRLYADVRYRTQCECNLLEPDEAKVSSPVLRGLGDS